MATKNVHATGLKIGGYVIFDGVACKISSIQISRPGKHGHAKCRIEAIGLVDSRKIIKLVPGHDNVEVPIIEKKTAQVLSIHGDSANVMDMESYETFDIKLPSELKDQVMGGAQILYWIIMGDKVMKQVK
ncbi:MAG: translation initiation factor IF-5A [Nanoarchaeota archaeon]|nr:translation initiation factor IF-5A [Nanoarchaeota archaeon]MBU1444831.1 translation initiation factor IF-5A [Nanoarchaeota archaeon]MBU2419999.1 translation initiation factor IF-5A [Nanoarchaeota archaeon]MBU2475434.1 translation initiation factor IF-5A [Nanoarchaeota archaeon]